MPAHLSFLVFINNFSPGVDFMNTGQMPQYLRLKILIIGGKKNDFAIIYDLIVP